jgi:hypothetical protein
MGLISNGTTVFDNGSMASGFGGNMVFIKKLTASGSGTLSFVDGASSVVLDNTYKEYVFTFKNMHPSAEPNQLTFNLSTDSGSNYNVTKTSTYFRAYHSESGSESGLSYDGSGDLAQSTGYQWLTRYQSSDNDHASNGYLHLYNPSSTTFVKHFTARFGETHADNYAQDIYIAGYGNTTSAVDAIQFKFSTGNIDAGDICLYGIA